MPELEWVGERAAARLERVVNRERAQAALAIGFPGPSRRDPDQAAAQVWAAVASGLGGRLFEALRDRRSLAYTVMASAWQKARAGALLAYIATSPEREEEAREEMLGELERFTHDPVSEVELRQAINYLAGQSEVGRQSGSAVAAEILEAWIAGAGLGELEDPGARFRSVTAADVLRVARRCLDRSRRVEGVVRGTGAARAQQRLVRAESPDDHFDPTLDVRRRPRGDVDEADPLVRRRVNHDVTLPAEHRHHDGPRRLPHGRWPVCGHPHGARGRDHQGRERGGIGQDSVRERRHFQRVLIEGRRHGVASATVGRNVGSGYLQRCPKLALA